MKMYVVSIYYVLVVSRPQADDKDKDKDNRRVDVQGGRRRLCGCYPPVKT